MAGDSNSLLYPQCPAFSDCRCSPNSLIEHYPNFNANLRTSLRRLVGEEVESRVDIGMAKDGSGVGGKFLA